MSPFGNPSGASNRVSRLCLLKAWKSGPHGILIVVESISSFSFISTAFTIPFYPKFQHSFLSSPGCSASKLCSFLRYAPLLQDDNRRLNLCALGCGPMRILRLTGVIIFFWTSNAYSRVTGIGSSWNCRGYDREGLEIWRVGLLGVGAVRATRD
uniref:Uncharacterized protein n=1 Tax=Fagus sylvatica TaxID=28930 RepID=A0A2N9EQ37_FAGSY